MALDKAAAKALIKRAEPLLKKLCEDLGVTPGQCGLTWDPTGGKFSVKFIAVSKEEKERADWAQTCAYMRLTAEHYGHAVTTQRGPGRLVGLKPYTKMPCIVELASGQRILVTENLLRQVPGWKAVDA